MTQKNSKVKIYLTEFRVQGENTIYEGPNIFASSSEIAENIAQEMGVTVVGELQDMKYLIKTKEYYTNGRYRQSNRFGRSNRFRCRK